MLAWAAATWISRSLLTRTAVLAWIAFAVLGHGERRFHNANRPSKSSLVQRQDGLLEQVASLLLAFKPSTGFGCHLQPGCANTHASNRLSQGGPSLTRSGYKSLRGPAELGMKQKQKCPHAVALDIDDDLARKISDVGNEGRVKDWVEGFIARHDLCPWAAAAARKDDIKVVVSDASDEASFLATLREEASALTGLTEPGLATTLVACTGTWAQDFNQFDDFVQNADVSPLVKLVSFHPDFSRWRDVDVKVGDAVLSYHWQNYAGMADTLALLEEDSEEDEDRDDAYLAQLVEESFGKIRDPQMLAQLKAEVAKELDKMDGEDIEDDEEILRNAENDMREMGLMNRTETTARGIILDMEEENVGVRSVLVRFEHGEEVIPREWIVGRDNEEPCHGPPLADNFLHRCPLPVAHLLRNDVLGDVSDDVGDDNIFELQFRNAQLMRRAAGILGRRP